LLDNKTLVRFAARDEQLRLPLRPRVPEDLVKVWHNRQTLVVFGSAEEVVFRGKAVAMLLPQLLPCLSGRLSVEEITGRMQGARPDSVVEALTMLHMHGLLEEGLVSTPGLSRELVKDFEPLLKFFSRYVDVTRVCANRYEVLGRLRASSVMLVGDGPAASRSLRELLDLGVGKVTLLPLDGAQLDSESAAAHPHTNVEAAGLDAATLSEGGADAARQMEEALAVHSLLLLISRHPRPRLTRLLNRLAVGSGVPFLRSQISEQRVEIGPAVMPRESGCCECAQLSGVLELDGPDSPAPGDEEPAAVGWASPEEQLGASRVTLHALSMLTRVIPVSGANKLSRLSFETLRFEEQPTYRMVGCVTCSAVKNYDVGRDLFVGPAHAENWPALFHFNTNDLHFNLAPKAYQLHYAASVVKMASAGPHKSYSTPGPPVELAAAFGAMPDGLKRAYDGGALGSPAAPTNGPVTIADVARLLMLTAGRRMNSVWEGWPQGRRLTPSGGNLASQQLYLFSYSVGGLAAGLYNFNSLDDTLEPLGAAGARETLEAAVPGAAGLGSRMAAVLVQTAVYGRVEHKYVSKAYRYCLHDSGAMLESLRAVSHALGLELRHTLEFYDDEVRDLIGLHTIQEFPLLVALLVHPLTQREPRASS
jgi:SagB-type dehydrogenase family enzyme